MSKETWDLLEGAAILVPVLILIFIAAKVLAAFRNAQFNKVLSPLVPLISGSIQGDGIHGSMTGTYDGNPVGVQITTETRSRRFEGHPYQRRNILTIEMGGQPGKQDWGFEYGRLRMLDQSTSHLSADEKALEDRLNHSGVVTSITSMGNVPVIHYSANRKMFTYIEDIWPALAPTPERFQKQLQLLVDLGGLNKRVNPA